MNDSFQDEPEPSMDLEFLVKTYNVRLTHVIRPFVRNSDDLEDILQDIWTKVYKSLRGFRGGSKIFTWIYRIGINTAISHMRKKRPDPLNDDLPDLRRSFNPEDEFEKKNLKEEIRKAVQKLSKNQRDVFLLRAFDEMPYEQISGLLGMTVTNAKTTYFYAVAKMRKLLKGLFEVKHG